MRKKNIHPRAFSKVSRRRQVRGIRSGRRFVRPGRVYEREILSGGQNAMNSYRKELWFNVPTRRGFINITPEVERCLRESGISEGLILVKSLCSEPLLFYPLLPFLPCLKKTAAFSCLPGPFHKVLSKTMTLLRPPSFAL